MKKFNKNTLATALGVAVISTFTAQANAETSPFAMTELANGYMQTAAANTKTVPTTVAPTTATKPATPAKTGGTCAEGKCGEMLKNKEGMGDMKHAATTGAKVAEAQCGAMMENDHMKAGMEKACGAMMKGKEGACGDMKPAAAKAEEGKCGEAKCGAMMENGHMKAGMEKACGAMMKGKEGACGDMKSMAVDASAAKSGEAKCGATMKGKEGACGDMVHETAAVTTPVPAAVAPAKPAIAAHPKTSATPKTAPAATAPAKPATPERATSNKVVEGQCAAVKEETHEASKHHEIDNKATAPWGNRKKVVNP